MRAVVTGLWRPYKWRRRCLWWSARGLSWAGPSRLWELKLVQYSILRPVFHQVACVVTSETASFIVCFRSYRAQCNLLMEKTRKHVQVHLWQDKWKGQLSNMIFSGGRIWKHMFDSQSLVEMLFRKKKYCRNYHFSNYQIANTLCYTTNRLLQNASLHSSDFACQ